MRVRPAKGTSARGADWAQPSAAESWGAGMPRERADDLYQMSRDDVREIRKIVKANPQEIARLAAGGGGTARARARATAYLEAGCG